MADIALKQPHITIVRLLTIFWGIMWSGYQLPRKKSRAIATRSLSFSIKGHAMLSHVLYKSGNRASYNYCRGLRPLTPLKNVLYLALYKKIVRCGHCQYC